MISLSEIAKLPYTLGSIKKIDLFLSGSVKGSNEYIKALCYKAKILHKTDKTNDALKLIYSYVPEFNKLDNESIIDICDEIMDICIDVKRYDQVIKYMSIKKDYLSISNLHLYLKDQIRLYLDMNDFTKAKAVLEKYLNDDLTKDEEIYALERLLDIYFNNQEYDKYLEKINILEDYYKDNLVLDKLSIITFNKIYIEYVNKNYIKVILDLKAYLDESPDDERYVIKAATILMKCYIACSDFKKASIVESDYEGILSKDYIEESIEFSYTALDLYSKMNSIVSINQYHQKIREFEEAKEPVKKKTKKNINVKEEDFSDIVIPIVEMEKDEAQISDIAKGRILNPNNVKEEFNNQEIILREKSNKEINVSAEFKNIDRVLDYINDSSLNLRLRDLFRAIGIELSKLFEISDIYLLYNDGQFKGLHYKMERAYDKKINVTDIEDTLNYSSYLYDAEMFLDDNDRKYNKNIITNTPYDDNVYGYAIPLHNSVGVIASIAYFSNNDFIMGEFAYESIKLVTKLFNTRLIFELQQKDVLFNNQKTFFIMNNMSQGIKEESSGYIHLNNNAQKILGALEDITFDDFINNMDSKYQAEYKRINNEINELLSPDITYEYKYRKNENEYVYVKEMFYPIMMDGSLFIFSLIEDITDYTNEKNKLKEIAYTNPVSKIDTEVKLLIDLRELGNIPYALAIFEIDDFKLYSDLYGFNFSNQLIYALGQELKKNIETEFRLSLYHLERDRYALLLRNINDKRVVDSKLRVILNNTSKGLHSLNSRLNIIFNCGVYKVSKNEEIKEDTLISYAIEGLNDAIISDLDYTRICHYNSNLSKLRFYENNLVTTISEALDKNRLSINYQQIVMLKTRRVMSYYIKLTLDNYEVEYDKVIEVAKRKNLLKQIDRYIVNNICIEEKMLRDKFKGFFEVIIPLHKECQDEISVKALKTAITQYKVNPSYITLLFNDIDGIENIALKYKELGVKIATRKIEDILTGIPYILFFDYHKRVSTSAEDIKNLCKNYNSLVIFDEINEKEDIIYAKDNNFEYVYGKYYKKLKRIKNIIEDLSKGVS